MSPWEQDTYTVEGVREATDAAEGYGTSIGAASRGAVASADFDDARLRLRDAQTALVSLGYLIRTGEDPAAGIDGVWSDATRDAVALFQEEYDLEVSGQLDRETYEALLEVYGQALSTQDPTPLQDDFALLQANQPLARRDFDLLIAAQEPLDDSERVMLDIKEDIDAGRIVPDVARDD
ncbi:MAG TPA: peptidoglycan-binding domain-containing protein [Myxococcota bacterium]|nr:peptidoglycan-binding domain-containing protein [Myxococcota bacterium]